MHLSSLDPRCPCPHLGTVSRAILKAKVAAHPGSSAQIVSDRVTQSGGGDASLTFVRTPNIDSSDFPTAHYSSTEPYQYQKFADSLGIPTPEFTATKGGRAWQPCSTYFENPINRLVEFESAEVREQLGRDRRGNASSAATGRRSGD